MIGLTPAAHRVLGVGMLLPTLLLAPHSPVSADGRPAQKTVPAESRPAQKLASAESRPTQKSPSADGRRTKKRVASKDKRAEAQVAAPSSCVHVVRRGDTVGRLATQYKVPQRSIVSVNHLGTGGALKVGQRIAVPGCKSATAKALRAPEPAVVDSGPGELLARVGPRRVPTRLYVAVPDFYGATAEFRWPIEGPILSGFGSRSGGWHAGVDIKGERGTPIRAAAPGTVVFSGAERFYGRMVRIEHSSGFTSTYAHNLENLVQIGDRVDVGDVIATVGRTGHASGYHVHFEIRREGMAYNPVHLLEAREGPIFVSNSELSLAEESGP